MPSSRRPPARATDTRERLLDASLRCAQQQGYGALSLQSIATHAEVSKALVLYHYRDKDDLLVTLIAWLTERLVSRERQALTVGVPSSVLEELWLWLQNELHEGELRVLIELASERSEVARLALEESAQRRHEAAQETVTRVFQALELTPRLPAAMLAACELAFRDGLVLATSRQASRNSRVAFDVFWLSLLSLAE